MAKQVQCSTHGRSAGCMICRHLREGSGLGYWRVEVPPGADFYETGLCEACDRLFSEEGGWTNRLFDFAGWQLSCRGCFEQALALHRLLGVGQFAPVEEDPGTPGGERRAKWRSPGAFIHVSSGLPLGQPRGALEAALAALLGAEGACAGGSDGPPGWDLAFEIADPGRLDDWMKLLTAFLRDWGVPPDTSLIAWLGEERRGQLDVFPESKSAKRAAAADRPRD